MKTHQIMMATMAIKNLVGCAIGSTYDEQADDCQPRIPHHKTDMEQNYFNNDIFWRAILDMNKILIYTDENGTLHSTQQRKYLNVADGIQAMEKSQHHEYGGGGIPYDGFVILAGIDPVAVDSVGCRIMGYDYSVIPSITNADLDTIHPIGTNDPEKIVVIGDEIDSEINHVYEFNSNWASDAGALAITDFTSPLINTINRDNYDVSAEIINGLAAYILYQAEGTEYIEKMIKDGDVYSGTISSTTSEYQILAQDEYFNTVQSKPQIIEDTTPPYTSGHDPADGATDVPIDTNIVVHVQDAGDGVDQATIVMTVEGAPVTPVITSGPADYTLTYDPPVDFGYLQVVDITIDASDPTGTPNAMTQDAYSFTTQAAGGGGGGGGGGLPPGVTFFTGMITPEGKFTEDITARSSNKMVTLIIDEGTIGKTSKGAPLSWVFIQPEDDFPTPAEGLAMISLAYDIAPYGTTFEPFIIIMFKYNPAMIPDGVDELDLFIATLDEQTGQWVPLDSHVDPENYTIRAEISGFSLYAVMAGTEPADISVTGLTIMPEAIYEGDDATVTVSLVNSGDFSGTYEVILRINGVTENTIEVNIAGNDSETVSFDLAGLENGTYQIAVGEVTRTLTVLEIIEPTPAAFTASSLEISPDEVDIGEDVNISVRVDNTGETEGVCQLVCKVNGVVIDEKEITLAGGSGESVVFTTTFNEVGGKNIEVNELSDGLVVKELEEEPSLEPGMIADIPTQEIPEEPVPTSGYGWINILILGVCALFIVVVIYLVKQKKI